MASDPDCPAAGLLHTWIRRHGPEAGCGWLEASVEDVATGSRAALARAFAIAPRRLGKADLDLSPADKAAADGARPGWRPGAWSVDQAARALLLLAFPAGEAAPYEAAIGALFPGAEVREHIALLRALPLLPHARHFLPYALAGVRSNIGAVFQAIAWDNPYPADHFDDAQWNAMILKNLFLDLSPGPIVGLAARSNGELARMAADLVRERRTAHRPPPPGAEWFVRTT